MATSDGPQSWRIELPLDIPAVRTARDAVAGWLADVPAQPREIALQVVHELVANAIEFGNPPIRVNVALGPDAIRVQVSDAGPWRPRRREPDETGGWGLALVERLAGDVRYRETEPHVECDIPLRP